MISSREMFLEQRENELKNQVLETKTYYYCTACKVNWARLETMADDLENEVYEFCPQCGSDMFLKANHDEPAFIMSVITGDIINLSTRKVVKREAGAFAPKNRKVFSWADWEKKTREREDLETEALLVYQAVYMTHGKEIAEKKYFEVFKKRDK